MEGIPARMVNREDIGERMGCMGSKAEGVGREEGGIDWDIGSGVDGNYSHCYSHCSCYYVVAG